MGPPYFVMSPIRAAGFPLMLSSFCSRTFMLWFCKVFITLVRPANFFAAPQSRLITGPSSLMACAP